MMKLSPVENADLDRYLRRFQHKHLYRAKVLKVIRMADSGHTIEEIEDVVKMSRGNIGSIKRWGRIHGLC